MCAVSHSSSKQETWENAHMSLGHSSRQCCKEIWTHTTRKWPFEKKMQKYNYSSMPAKSRVISSHLLDRTRHAPKELVNVIVRTIRNLPGGGGEGGGGGVETLQRLPLNHNVAQNKQGWRTVVILPPHSSRHNGS